MQAFQSNAAASEQASQGNSPQPSWTFRTSPDGMPNGNTGHLHPEQDMSHGLERTLSGGRNDRLARWWVEFDARYLQPVFGGPHHQPGEALQLTRISGRRPSNSFSRPGQ